MPPKQIKRSITSLADDEEQKFATDVQRLVTQFYDRDFDLRSMMPRMEELAIQSSGPGLEELMGLLVRGKDVGNCKVRAVESMSDMVTQKLGVSENLGADGSGPSTSARKPAATATSTATATEPKEKPHVSARDPKPEKGADRVQADAVDKPVKQRNTPMPRSTATLQLHLLQEQTKTKKSAQKAEAKPKTKSTVKKHKKKVKAKPPVTDDDWDSDLPEFVDPNEPTYCLCDRVSFGNMICCDNDLCPIEWFHFKCISMVVQPKGKWFCPKCRGERSNIMKPKAIFLKELERYNKEREERG